MTTQALEPTPQEVLDDALAYMALGLGFWLAGWWLWNAAGWRWLERVLK